MAEHNGSGNLEKFQNAFTNSMPGDIIIYHIGRSLRGPSGQHAYYLYEKGMVELTQRRARRGKGIFEYLAIRTKRHRHEQLIPLKAYQRPRIE